MAAREKILQRTAKNAKESSENTSQPMARDTWQSGKIFGIGKVSMCAYGSPHVNCGEQQAQTYPDTNDERITQRVWEDMNSLLKVVLHPLTNNTKSNIMSITMNTTSDVIRLSITIPRSLVNDLKTDVDNLSKYITEAIQERRKQEQREKAWQELLDAPPTFTEIDDPVAFIRDLRAGDEERLKRLGV